MSNNLHQKAANVEDEEFARELAERKSNFLILRSLENRVSPALFAQILSEVRNSFFFLTSNISNPYFLNIYTGSIFNAFAWTYKMGRREELDKLSRIKWVAHKSQQWPINSNGLRK